MAFFSGNRRGGGGGGVGGIFGQSVLPTTSSRPKPSRSSSSRRRGPLRDLLPRSPSTSIFALGLSLSLLLLLSVVLRYGVPNPLNLHPRSHRSSSSSSPRLTRRPNIRRPAPNLDLSASDSTAASSKIASVDITTKDLYDRIEFLDVDGGPWKQGWRVSYVGNEWDQEKLKVFVVPHSHNDPGWKLTVEEYYERQSKHILDTIVESLSKVRGFFFFFFY